MISDGAPYRRAHPHPVQMARPARADRSRDLGRNRRPSSWISYSSICDLRLSEGGLFASAAS